MIEQRVGSTDRRASGTAQEDAELASFVQNINAVENIVSRMEADAFGPAPNIDRLGIFQSEIESILDELIAQKVRAIEAHGEQDENVQRLNQLMQGRLTGVTDQVDRLMHEALSQLKSLKQQLDTLEPGAAASSAVDNTEPSRQDAPMTDLTRQEVDAKLAANKAEVEARLASFDASIKAGFADLRTEFAQIRTEMAKQTTEVHKGTIDVIKWVVGFGIAILGTVFTLSKTAEKPPAQPTAQPAPIVITVPGQAAAPPTAPTAK